MILTKIESHSVRSAGDISGLIRAELKSASSNTSNMSDSSDLSDRLSACRNVALTYHMTLSFRIEEKVNFKANRTDFVIVALFCDI